MRSSEQPATAHVPGPMRRSRLARPPRRQRRLRVLLIDDPDTLREQAAWLDGQLGPTGELVPAVGFDDAERIVAAGDATPPDLVLFEPLAAGCDDLAALERLRARFPDVRFAAFSRRCNAFEAMRLLRLGLHGYIPRGTSAPVLRAAIQLILAGGRYLPPCLIGETAVDAICAEAERGGDGVPPAEAAGCIGGNPGVVRGIVFRRVLHPGGRLSYPFIWTSGPDAFAIDQEALRKGTARDAALAAMHPADRAAWDAKLLVSAADLTPHCAEFRLADRRGRYRWYRSVARPSRVADGSVVWDGYSIEITREKEAAAAQSREDRLRTIFDGTFQFIGLLSPLGILLEANQTALDFGGLGYADVIGRPFWEVRWWSLSRRHRDEVRAAIARATAGQFVRYEAELLGGDGRVVTVDFSLKPVPGEDGRARFLIAEGRDISSRPAGDEARHPAAGTNDPAAEIEGRLRDSGRRLEAIVANLPGAIFRGARAANGEPTFLFVSRGIADIAGITPEQLLANPAALYDLVHPEDLPAHMAAIQESYRTLQPFNRTFRVITPSGELRWLRSIGQPWRTRGGEIISDGVVVDITHQRETEERLRQRERILGALTDNLPAVVLRCVMGPEGRSRCTFVAGDLESLTGLSVESMLSGSTPLSSRVHPDDRAAYRAAQRRAAAALGELDHEFRFLMPDGEVRWLRLIARMRPEPGGRVHSDGVLLDVTEHRRALEALDRRNRDLVGLCRISEIALKSPSLDAGLRGIIDEIGDRLTGFDTASVDLYDEDRQLIEFRAYKSFGTGRFAPGQLAPVEETLAGEVIRTGQILVQHRCLDRSEPRFTRIREVGHQTFVGVPIRVGQRVIGSFGLSAAGDIDVDPYMVELASSWADYIASFIASHGAEEVAALTNGAGRRGDGAAFEVAFAARLTPRQRDVLAELAKGRSNKDIAIELGLQEATVKIHVRAILKALHAANRTQAANIANAVTGAARRPKLHLNGFAG